MRSVADDLRRLNPGRILGLPLAARIELALTLGDDDLALFARTAGLARDEARQRLLEQRSRGRRPSIVNRPGAR